MRLWDKPCAVLLALVVVSCSSTRTEIVGPSCAEGTVLVDGQCTSDLTCGAETFQVGGDCVSVARGPCGSGTFEAAGQCQPVPDAICGEDTEQVFLECVGIPGPDCGSGTALQGRQCVVADELSCGSGTERVGNECLSTITCGEGTVEVGEDCVSERVLGDLLRTVCHGLGTEFCEEVQSCCGAQPVEPVGLTLADILGDQATCEIFMRASCYQALSPQIKAVALGQARSVANPRAVLAPWYEVTDCELTVEQLEKIDEISEAVVVTPLQSGGQACIDNFACAAGLTCVTDAAGSSVCLTRGSAGIRCDRGDDDDCQDGFYCSPEAGAGICAPYATLESGNDDCTSRRCDPDLGYCDDGTCVPYLGLADSCLTDLECGAEAYCLEGACGAFQAESDACDETLRCGPGLICDEGVCVAEQSVCTLVEEDDP